MTLEDALGVIAQRYQISLIYNPSLLAGLTAPAVLPDGEIDSILRSLLDGSGLVYVRLASGTFAVLRAESRPPAPASGTVRGRVFDAESGAPLADVHVYLEGHPQLATATDAEGAFALNGVPVGRRYLRARHLAYGPMLDSVVVRARAAVSVDLWLKPVAIPLETVRIEDRATPWPLIRPERDDFMRGSMGTRDVVRALEVLPGVRVDRATSNLHIQGGDVGEHQVILDGAPVFEPVHLRGLLGAFSPFALRAVTVHGAGFGASLGSHLSGVITAQHALGSAEGHHVEVRADPLSLDSRISLNEDLGNNVRIQAMAALRTEHGIGDAYTTRYLSRWNQLDPFLQYASLVSLMEDDPESGEAYARFLDPAADTTLAAPGLDFTDLHAAARFQFGGGTYIFASVYGSANEMVGGRLIPPADTAGVAPQPTEAQPADAYDWRNFSGQITFAQPLGEHFVVQAQVRQSRYVLDHGYLAPDNRSSFWIVTPDLKLRELRLETRPADDGNHVSERAASASLHSAFGRWGTMQAGLEMVQNVHRFQIDDLFFRPIQSEGTERRYAGFLEHEIVSGDITLRGGLRLTRMPGRSAPYAEPRLSATVRNRVAGRDRYALRLAGGLYRQFLNQYDLSSISPSALMPSIRFWLPTDTTVAPPKAYHAAASLSMRPDERWTFSADAYLRYQPHVLNVDYASLWERLRDDSPPATTQAEFLERARGQAYGVAAGVSYVTSELEAWLRGDLGRSRRTFSFLGDALQDVPWNEPVALQAAVTWRAGPGLRLSADWRSSWGRAWAFRRAYYDYLGADELLGTRFAGYDLRDPDAHRLPPFHQLNVGVRYRSRLRWADVVLGLDLLNVLNRRNVVDYALDFSYSTETGLSYNRSARATAPRMLVAAVSIAF